MPNELVFSLSSGKVATALRADSLQTVAAAVLVSDWSLVELRYSWNTSTQVTDVKILVNTAEQTLDVTTLPPLFEDASTNAHTIGAAFDTAGQMTDFFIGHVYKACFYSSTDPVYDTTPQCTTVYCNTCHTFTDTCLLDCNYNEYKVDDETCGTCTDPECSQCLRETDCGGCVGPLCVECDDWVTCTECKDNASETSGSCTCDPGFFNSGLTCDPCGDNCDICDSSTNCTTCTQDHYLVDDVQCFG
jgi:hypothetical protein